MIQITKKYKLINKKSQTTKTTTTTSKLQYYIQGFSTINMRFFVLEFTHVNEVFGIKNNICQKFVVNNSKKKFFFSFKIRQLTIKFSIKKKNITNFQPKRLD